MFSSANLCFTLHASSMFPIVDYECNQNEYRCNSDGLCVEKRFLCDGIRHCSDGEDEKNETCTEGKQSWNWNEKQLLLANSV